MSLDFYTEEKAGVILTRMTSDVESLQNLLQDGFAQFGIQALTMVVVTAVLIHYDLTLALITLALVAHVGRHAVRHGYRRQHVHAAITMPAATVVLYSESTRMNAPVVRFLV